MNSSWSQVPLSCVIKQNMSYIFELEDRPYSKLSVKLYGRGCVLDGYTDGKDVKMKRHQLAKSGQVILSEIWGKKGAIGIVPDEGEGALITSHFFLFEIDNTKVLTDWIEWLTRANYFENELSLKAKGSTGYAAVRPNQFLSLMIPLPSIEDQQRIIRKIKILNNLKKEIIDFQVTSDLRLADAIQSLIFSISEKEQNTYVPLSEVLMRATNTISVVDTQIYRQVTVHMHNQGLSLRQERFGNEIKTKKQNVIRSMQFIFSKIDARNGAMGLVPPELNEAIVSNDFPVFEVDFHRLHPDFLNYYSASEPFASACIEKSKGTSNRKRLNEKDFLQISIPLPSYEKQLKIVLIAKKLEQLRLRQVVIKEELERLFKSLLIRAFQSLL